MLGFVLTTAATIATAISGPAFVAIESPSRGGGLSPRGRPDTGSSARSFVLPPAAYGTTGHWGQARSSCLPPAPVLDTNWSYAGRGALHGGALGATGKSRECQRFDRT